jgi:nucleoside-diphosphate-sugar epimerase
MKILITGNQGYIGPILTRHLRNTHPDATIVGMDMGFFEQDTVVPGALANKDQPHEQRTKDVREVTAEDFRGIDAVVHLAAISNDPMGKAFEEVTFEVNHKASVRVAQAAKEAGVRKFVFASSCSVYGKAGNQQCGEDAPLFPLTAYAISKARAEEDLSKIATSNFQVTAYRFATACGASPRIRLDLVLNDFVATGITSKRIDILSDGTPWRPLIDVQDMSRAFEWAVYERDAHGPYMVLNAGRSDWNFQIRALADTVSKMSGGIPVTVNPAAAPDSRSYSVDFTQFEKLGILAKTPRKLDQSVSEVLSVLADAKDLTPEFRTSRFIRLKTLTNLREAGKLDQTLRWNGR